MATNEELERRLALMREISLEKEKIAQLDAGERQRVVSMAQLFLQRRSSLQKLIKLKEKHAAKMSEEGKLQAAQDAQLEADKAKFVLQKLKEKSAEHVKAAKIARQADKDVAKSAIVGVKKVGDAAAGVFISPKLKGLGMDLFDGPGGPGSFAKNVMAQGKRVSSELTQQFQGSGGFAGSGGGVAGFLLGGLGRLVGGVAGLITEELEKNVRQVKTNVIAVIKELDTEYKKYRENVGIDLGAGAYQAFLSAMDVGTSMAKNFNKDPSNKMQFFGDVHVNTQEASAALTAMTNQVSGFSKLMKDPGTEAFAGQLTNQAAAFSRLGIKAASTAKIFETASKAQKMNAQEMAKMSRQVVSVGVALDKNLNEVVEDFNKMAPTLVQFGDEMTGVFARLEAQSKATGIAANDLLNTAMRFDTFEGAAKAAGRLNAVLGQTAIDTMALIHANPDEKIDMMRKAVTSTLGPFNQLDRRTQSVIANVMGLKGGVEEAQKLFQSDAAYDEYAKKVTSGKEATVLNAEKLKELMEGTANVDRLLKTSATSAAHTLNTATYVMQKAAKATYFGADLLGGAISVFTPTVGQGSPDVTPVIDPTKLKKTQAGLDATMKKKKALQGAPGVTPPGAKPKAPTTPPSPKIKGPTNTNIKRMAASARELRKALAPLPNSIDKIAESLVDLTSGKSGRALKLLREAIGEPGPKTVTVDKKTITAERGVPVKLAVAMSTGLSTLAGQLTEKGVAVASDPSRSADLDKAFNELNKLSATMSEGIKAMPSQLSTAYREVVKEKKSLDTTKYLENYTTVVKEQNINTKELAEKMDKLIEVLGGKEKADQPLQLVGPVKLRIGNAADIDTVIEDSLERLKIRLGR